ncbi:MAG: hypothetical protein QNJ36_10845 [Calothrix sp. MO_167.B42]|nr:hypothetical protein [Calothrix sp. MO_167.B42]
MSGYFSRLIQQTEIALGTGETNSRAVQPNETITPLRDEVAAFQPLEEIQAIAPPEDGEFGTQGNVQIKGQGDGEEKFQSTRKQGDADNSARTVSLSSGDLPQPKQLEKQVEFSWENILPSDDVETGLSFPNTHPKVQSEKILDSPKSVVQQTPPSPETSLRDRREEAFPLLPAPFPPASSFGESLRAKPTQPQPATISQEYNPLPTHQVNLQAVREWVGGTENSTVNSTLNTDPYQFPHSQPQERQNFKLAIGTISLTVEAPQRSVQQPPLPPRKPQQKVKPVSPISRLNRHYLRF